VFFVELTIYKYIYCINITKISIENVLIVHYKNLKYTSILILTKNFYIHLHKNELK